MKGRDQVQTRVPLGRPLVSPMVVLSCLVTNAVAQTLWRYHSEAHSQLNTLLWHRVCILPCN